MFSYSKVGGQLSAYFAIVASIIVYLELNFVISQILARLSGGQVGHSIVSPVSSGPPIWKAGTQSSGGSEHMIATAIFMITYTYSYSTTPLLLHTGLCKVKVGLSFLILILYKKGHLHAILRSINDLSYFQWVYLPSP